LVERRAKALIGSKLDDAALNYRPPAPLAPAFRSTTIAATNRCTKGQKDQSWPGVLPQAHDAIAGQARKRH